MYIENHNSEILTKCFLHSSICDKKIVQNDYCVFLCLKFWVETLSVFVPIHSNFLSTIFSTKKNSIRGIKSCNIAFYKKDCISVNGFNHEFEGWGREDSEFFIRLMNKGVKRKTLKFNAIQYHLWHIKSNRDSLAINDQLLNKTIVEKLDWCEMGISFFL